MGNVGSRPRVRRVWAKHADFESGGRGRAPWRSEETYRALRSAIFSGEWAAGTEISEQRAADRVSVSRTPVREALHRLEEDGLVKRHRGGGYFVVDVTVTDVVNAFAVREGLEGMVGRLASERVGSAEVEALAELVEQMEARFSEGSADQVVALNERFHRQIAVWSGNDYLVALWSKARRFGFGPEIAAMYGDEEIRVAVSGHGAIVEALKRGDPDAAEAASRHHVRRASIGAVRVYGNRMWEIIAATQPGDSTQG